MAMKEGIGMRRPWLDNYPADVPFELPPLPYTSLAVLFEHAFTKYRKRTAVKFLGHRLSFGELDHLSGHFAAYLQSLGLRRGDRVALMLPNVPQYVVAVAGIARAGLVAVNTNPLYTARELRHQMADSGAKAIIILENVAATLEACLDGTAIEHVVLAAVGDMLPPFKRIVVNTSVRRVRKLVPPFTLPDASTWRAAMRRGAAERFRPVESHPEDVAMLQYTGGTTGISKGAMLTHGNVVANILQSQLWNQPALASIPEGEQPHTICALPLYHIFGFTVNLMLTLLDGGCSVLILNPRDVSSLVKELRRQRFHLFPAVNTLFGAIARHPDAARVDWSSLRISLGGGMAVQAATAELWLRTTGCAICEGYGLSETSPSVSCNPILSKRFTGTIGYPLPSTDLRIINENGDEVPWGESGEIAVKGPQVMAGYWNRPDETAQAFSADGFFRTGDIGRMADDGAVTIVDRKKDMINVSGFNVYPNEIEDIVTRMPGIAEAAAIGVPDEGSGEAVKLFVVAHDPELTPDAVRLYCRDRLTGYKRPREIEFRPELPKTPVGKILRRALRD